MSRPLRFQSVCSCVSVFVVYLCIHRAHTEPGDVVLYVHVLCRIGTRVTCNIHSVCVYLCLLVGPVVGGGHGPLHC